MSDEALILIFLGIVLIGIVYAIKKSDAEEIEKNVEEYCGDLEEEVPEEQAVLNNITEPVQTIIKLFKDNPKDFKLENKWDSVFEYQYKITHKPSGIVARVGVYIRSRVDNNNKIIRFKKYFLQDVEGILPTSEEESLLKDTFTLYFEARKVRFEEIQKIREARAEVRLRKEITSKVLGSVKNK